jgi:uncharacterized protein
MLLYLSEMVRANKPLVREETVELEGIEREVPQLVRLDPVRVRVKALEENGLFHVHAEQRTRASFTCSRCLSPFEKTLSGQWTQVFTNRADRAEQEEICFVEGDHIDLTPYVREAVLLEIPYAPVCREECRGLCPECGADRNWETCSCRTERIDPRLAVLKELRIPED